jgi:hypothetical protein
MSRFKTRESFTKNVIYRQNFVNHSFFSQILAESEALFHELRGMETYVYLQAETVPLI